MASMKQSSILQGVAPKGSVLQVVSTTKTDTFTTTSTSFADLTGLAATITPGATSSKILVMVKTNYSASDQVGIFRLLRNSTVIAAGGAAGSRSPAFASTRSADTSAQLNISTDFLDSPATSSAVTYKVQIAVQGGTGYVNRNANDADASTQARTVSTITLMEMAG